MSEQSRPKLQICYRKSCAEPKPTPINGQLGNSEAKECSLFRKWYSSHAEVAPQLGRIFFIANEGARNGKFAGILKNKGWRAGFSDYAWLIGPKGRCVFLEFKVDLNKQSEAQKEFAKLCKEAGADYEVFYSWKEAATFCTIFLFSEYHISQDVFEKLLESIRGG